MMAKGRKVRLFLRNKATGETRYIAWFELRGYDFYYGLAEPSFDIPGFDVANGEVAVVLPEAIKDLPKSHWRASWHESGKLHVNTDGGGAQRRPDVEVLSTRDLTEPTHFALLIDKVPSERSDSTTSFTKEGGSALVLQVDESEWTRRHYFEFFLSPAGTFSPPPLLFETASEEGTRLMQSLGEDVDIVLIVRHFVVGDALADWRPEVAIWVHVDPGSVGPLGLGVSATPE